MSAPTSTDSPGRLTAEIDALNAVLRHEIAAVEAYELILPGFEDHAFATDLRTIRYAHETAADALRAHVRNLGGEPVAGGVVLLYSSRAAVGPIEAVLERLRRTEEQGVGAYERLLQREEMPEECRFTIRARLLARCYEHLDALTGMGAAASRKG